MSEKKVILLIDDDVAFVESNKDLLEAYDYEVHTANDGSAGIEVAKKVRPDVMILDVMMASDTEGFDVARKVPEIRELKNMKVILVTGMNRELGIKGKLKPDATWLPVDRILEKPISPERLIAEIERVLKEG